jgi:hypothetical protein
MLREKNKKMEDAYQGSNAGIPTSMMYSVAKSKAQRAARPIQVNPP